MFLIKFGVSHTEVLLSFDKITSIRYNLREVKLTVAEDLVNIFGKEKPTVITCELLGLRLRNYVSQLSRDYAQVANSL